MKVIILPFIAFDAEKENFQLPEILKLSILHHARFSDKYYLITNIKEKYFRTIKKTLGNKFEAIQYTEFISKETNQTIVKLNRLWSTGVAKANHPATEQLCFLRWLLLRDWLSSNNNENDIYLLHDWDDLAFEDPFNNLNELLDGYTIPKSFVASFTEVGLCQWMQPNLTFFTYNAIVDYCKFVDYFIYSYESGKNFNLPQKGFLDDCLPWSYTINKYRALATGSFFNLMLMGDNMRKANSIRLQKIYFNTTIRTPENFEKNEFFVPRNYNHSGSTTGMISLLNIKTDKRHVFVTSIGDKLNYRLVNIHFTGTESKYALLNGYLNQITNYYKNSSLLREQLKENNLESLVEI